MRTLIPGLLALTLFAAPAWGQSDEAPWFGYETDRGTLEVSLSESTVWNQRGGVSTHRPLTDEEAAAVWSDYVYALEETEGKRPADSPLVVFTAPPSSTCFDPAHPAVRYLRARLLGLQSDLVVHAGELLRVQLETPASPTASRAVAVSREGEVSLAYRQGPRTIALPQPELTAEERAQLAEAIRAYEASDPVLPDPAPPVPGKDVRLVLDGALRVCEFSVASAAGLPGQTQPLRRVLEGVLERAFRYRERVLEGRVIEGGRALQWGDQRLVVPVELALALQPRAGKAVRFLALINDDGSWLRPLALVTPSSGGLSGTLGK